MKTTFLTLLLIAAGCGQPLDDDGDDQLVSQTVVTLHPDGTETVNTHMIPASQQKAEVELSYVGACSASSIQLFNGTSFTGTEICFETTGGIGTIDLTKYYVCPAGKLCYKPSTWAGRVRSYRSGTWNNNNTVQQLWVQANPTCRECWNVPKTGQRSVAVAGSCAQQADLVGLPLLSVLTGNYHCP
jgi:hypothetical protein